MNSKKKYTRFLLMLLPLIPALALMAIPGFLFSVVILVGISLVIGLYCLLSLYPGKTSKILRTVLTILLVTGLLFGIGTEAYLLMESQEESTPCKYIIVLGAGVNGTEPSLILQNRIDKAYEYLTEHPEVICIVSGARGNDEKITEAQCMFRELTEMGISPDRIWLEEKATSTVENIEFSRELIEKKSGMELKTVGIISNEFHMPRAQLIAENQGLQAVCIPADTSWLLLKVNYYLREAAALWKFLLLGGN